MKQRGGAPVGNDNAARGSRFRDALRRALSRAGGTVDGGLDKLADNLVNAAMAGEQWAVQMVADRMDGKPAQTVLVGDAPEEIQAPNGDELTKRLHKALAGRAAIDAEANTLQ